MRKFITAVAVAVAISSAVAGARATAVAVADQYAGSTIIAGWTWDDDHASFRDGPHEGNGV